MPPRHRVVREDEQSARPPPVSHRGEPGAEKRRRSGRVARASGSSRRSPIVAQCGRHSPWLQIHVFVTPLLCAMVRGVSGYRDPPENGRAAGRRLATPQRAAARRRANLGKSGIHESPTVAGPRIAVVEMYPPEDSRALG